MWSRSTDRGPVNHDVNPRCQPVIHKSEGPRPPVLSTGNPNLIILHHHFFHINITGGGDLAVYTVRTAGRRTISGSHISGILRSPAFVLAGRVWAVGRNVGWVGLGGRKDKRKVVTGEYDGAERSGVETSIRSFQGSFPSNGPCIILATRHVRISVTQEGQGRRVTML